LIILTYDRCILSFELNIARPILLKYRGLVPDYVSGAYWRI